MRSKALYKSALAIILAFAMLITPCIPTRAEGEAVYISSAQDLINVAKDCRLDTYSLGKTFILTEDIQLEGTKFEQIPVLRGKFEGNGHIISGFVVRDSAAPAGLFGIIERDGSVKDLRVGGNVAPKGDGEAIGGIAGINRGVIDHCDFDGIVTGKEEVGGIAGVNDYSGIIKSSGSTGKITGQKTTGGIAGSNHGLIDGSSSYCLVNSDSSDPTINIDEIESGMHSAAIYNSEVEKIYSTIEDAGGITGFSDGIVTNCTNNGDIGYSHIGYNMGGVVGRNQGFVYGSANYGQVNGRREVGGIVGQAEPYVSFTVSADNLGGLRTELNNLKNLVDKATRDAEDATSRASERLSNINDIISKASDNVNDLTDILTSYVDENLEEVNRGGEVVKSASERLDSISKKLPDINFEITNAIDRITDGVDELRKAGAGVESAMGDMDLAIDDLNVALGLLEDAGSYISDGAGKISEAITIEDKKVKEVDWDAVKEGVSLVSKGFEIIDKGNEASDNKGAYSYITSASNHIKDGISKIRAAGRDLDDALFFFEETSEIMSKVSTDITSVLEEVSSLTEFLSNTEPLQFSYIKSKTDQTTGDLHNNMTNLNRELESLNLETGASSDNLMADLRAINDQFFAVMELLIDEIDEFKNATVTERIEDVSDEDIKNSTDGKIQFCVNYGMIFGDINVGGVAGSMGIFNKQNPEDDNITINDVLRARYKLKAILQDCTNYGDVTSKKDFVGAICGISSLGVITDCKGFGKAISEDGNYAGGISGGNSTIIRNSFAKCSLSGKKYVGGITGLNSTKDNGTGSVKNCVSAINIVFNEQYAGAICGYDEGEIKGNYFFGDYTGINNASYSGKAEPISFEELIAIENIPNEFKRFRISFVANDLVVKEVDLDYMASYTNEEFPEVPAVDGQYGKWDKNNISKVVFDQVVTAEYFPYVTAIATEEDDAPSRFLAIGKFDDVSTIEASLEIKGESELGEISLPSEFFALIKPREEWLVTANDLKNDNVFLRYYKADEKAESLRFYVKNNSTWEKVEASEVGTYMQFEAPSGTNAIVVANRTSYIVFFILFIIALIIILVLILIFKLIKRHRNRPEVSQKV